MMKRVLFLFPLILFFSTIVRAQCLEFDTVAVFGQEADDYLEAFACDRDERIYTLGISTGDISIFDSVFSKPTGSISHLLPRFAGRVDQLSTMSWSRVIYAGMPQSTGTNVDFKEGHTLFVHPVGKASIDGQYYVEEGSPVTVIQRFSDSGGQEKVKVDIESLSNTGALLENGDYISTTSGFTWAANNPQPRFDGLQIYSNGQTTTKTVVEHQMHSGTIGRMRHPAFRIKSIKEGFDGGLYFVGQLTLCANSTITIGGAEKEVIIPGWPEKQGCEFFVVIGRVNSNGTVVQHILWSSGSGADIHDFEVDGQGNVFMTGRVNGSISFGTNEFTSNRWDAFIAKTDFSLSTMLLRPISGQGTIRSQGITLNESGDFGYLTGDFEKEINFDEKYVSPDSNNAFVARFSSDLDWEAVNFIEGEGEVHSRGIDFYDEHRVVVGVNFTKTVRTDDEKYASAGGSDFMFAVMSYDENCEGPFSTEDVSLSTSDLTLYPNPATNGEFRVRCDVGIESAVFYTLSGAEVPAQLSGRGGEELTVRVLTDKKQMIIGKFVDKNGNTEVRKIVVNP